MTSYEYVFPAIRGVQAKREYYISMCPLRVIPKIFLFNEDELELGPELRAQRVLNKNRIPEMARYLVANRDNYIFSALTASIDAAVIFDPAGSDSGSRQVGLLRVPMSAQVIINDGQHRRAAIEAALKEAPELADETIAVVFFLDQGLSRCQQMFADLNRHAIRPSRSLGLLYDHRDDTAQIARQIVFKTTAFKGMVEMEKSTLSARSRKLFTLSAIHNATAALFAGQNGDQSGKDRIAVASEFWDEIGSQFPEWSLVRDGKADAGEIRRDYIHSHGITLQALGRAGNSLIASSSWKRRLKALRQLNWSRNAELWEGRALNNGRVSKATPNVMLTTNVIKRQLDLDLTPEEQRLEDLFAKGGR